MGELLFKDSTHNQTDKLNDWYLGNPVDLERFEYQTNWIYEDYIWFEYSNNMPVPKVDIRKFVKNELCGDVLVSEESIEKITRRSSWDSSGFSSLRYINFKFDIQADFVAFKLKFNDFLTDQEQIEQLKQSETSHEQKRRQARELGEYWSDRRE